MQVVLILKCLMFNWRAHNKQRTRLSSNLIYLLVNYRAWHWQDKRRFYGAPLSNDYWTNTSAIACGNATHYRCQLLILTGYDIHNISFPKFSC